MIIEVFPPLVVGALKPSIMFRSLRSLPVCSSSLPSSLQLAPTLPHSPLHPTGGGDPNTYMAIGSELRVSWERAGSELGASWSELERGERAGARGASWEQAGVRGVRGVSWSELGASWSEGSELE